MGFPIKDFTETDCVAVLMGLYEEMVEGEISTKGKRLACPL